MENQYQEFLDTALELAKESGKVIHEAFYNRNKIIEHKGLTDLVTGKKLVNFDLKQFVDTDKKVEQFVIGTLKKKYPDHQFLGEESFDGESYNLTDAPTWIIDPIDGTTNFVHKYEQKSN